MLVLGTYASSCLLECVVGSGCARVVASFGRSSRLNREGERVLGKCLCILRLLVCSSSASYVMCVV